ncbi:hypothetical protein CKO31_10940 [Thiohalocapsa halophila]|uniref:Uncharacterized protein n=1 Tax=Thiohalocapsa halophila TaxID=69359 RepID=A0ABS1CH50_9GAMM|nr:hypothetical protein [Thiohalocapsa halophila]MBK1631245.1 hypothetical protein [Thiohalocapsa halophila]
MKDPLLRRARRPSRSAWLSVLAGVILPAGGAAGLESAAAQISPEPVPGIAVGQDIEHLDPIALRRQVSRAEGRISDLEKDREAALAGLEGAIAEAETRATAAASRSGSGGAPSDAAATAEAQPARRTPPLLDPATQADRRRAIRARYGAKIARARRQLARLLARQAQIDPDAPDQQRLRDAARAGEPAP